MWPFKKKEKEKPKVILSNTLFLFMRDKPDPHTIVAHQPWTGGTNKRSIVKPWKKFYKWFFCSDKEYFIIPIEKGLMTIRRSQLLTFKIRIEETEN